MREGRIRQGHRWIAVAFTLGVALNFAMGSATSQPPVWVLLCAGVPLVLLFLTGAWMFVRHYFGQGA